MELYIDRKIRTSSMYVTVSKPVEKKKQNILAIRKTLFKTPALVVEIYTYTDSLLPL